MAEDILDELFGVERINSDKDLVIGSIDAVVARVQKAAKEVGTLAVALDGSITGYGELNELLKKADGITKDAALNTQRLAKAKLDEAKADTERAKASKIATEEQLKKNKADEQAEKLSARTQANLAKENNAYEQAKKLYRDTANEAKRLYFEKGKDNAETVKTIALAHQQYTALLQAESAVGQMQRQVGNYNIVGAQFATLLSELPNLALNFRTWVISMSNNLVGFANSLISSAKEMGSWKRALGQLLTSSNLLVFALNLAVTAFTYFTMEMTKSEKKTKALKDETNELADALERNIQAERDLMELRRDKNRIGGEADLKRQIDLMKAQGRSELEIFTAQQAYHHQKAENLRDEAATYGVITKATDDYFAHFKKNFPTYSKSAIDQLVAAELTKTIKDNTRTTEEEAQKQADAIVKSYGKANGAYETLTVSRMKLLSKAKDEEAQININSTEFQRKLTEEITEDDKKLNEQQKKDYEKMLKAKQKAFEEWRDYQRRDAAAQLEVEQAQIEAEIEIQEGILNSEESTAEQRRKATERLQELRVTAATKTAVFEAMQTGKTAKEIESIYDILTINIEKIWRKGSEERDKINKDETEKTEKETKMKMDNLRALGEFGTNIAKEQADQDKKEAAERDKRIKAWVAQMQQAAKIFVDLQNKRTANVLAGLDREQEEVQNTEVRERARAERTIQDEKAREEAILKIETEAEDKRQQIDEKRKAAQIQQANREKALALISVIANLVVGVSKEIASKGVAGLATGAAISLYTATLTSAIAALSVPAYEHGTDKHPGGPAIVGEGKSKRGYKPELVKMPGGKSFVTDGPQYIPNLPAGSKVIPMPDLNMPGVAMQQIATAAMLAGGGNSAKTEALLHELISEVRNGNNIPRETVRERDGITHKSQQVGHARYNYLRQNIYE